MRAARALPLALIPGLLVTLAAGGAFASAASLDRAPWKRAVLIAVEDYHSNGAAWSRTLTPASDLPSARLDLTLMESLLHDWLGFEVTTLRDGGATGFGVAQRLRMLAERARVGDRIVIYFTGHGISRRGLLLHNGPFEESELTALMRQFPAGVKPVLILDCCYAAAMSKGAADLLGLGPVKYASLPEDLRRGPSSDRGTRLPRGGAGSPKAAKAGGKSLPYVRLAACRPEEASHVLRDPPVSPFTLALYQTLTQAERPVSYLGLRDGIRARLQEMGVAQSPQLDGSFRWVDPALGAPLPRRSPGVPVEALPGGGVLIHAGRLARVHVGDTLHLYPLASKGEAARPRAVVVQSVETDRASGRPAASEVPSPGPYWGVWQTRLAPLPAWRAVFGLLYDRGVPDRVVKALESLPDIAVVEQTRGTTSPADAVISLEKTLTGYRASLVAPGTEWRSTLDARDAADLTAQVRPLLAAVAELRLLHRLVRTAPGQELRLWTDRADNRFRIGSVLTLHAWARRECYLHLLTIGEDGALITLFPNSAEPDNHLLAGKETRIPARAGSRGAITVNPPAGCVWVFAIAADQPLNLAASERYAVARGAFKGVPAQHLQDWADGFLQAIARPAAKGAGAGTPAPEETLPGLSVVAIPIHILDAAPPAAHPTAHGRKKSAR